MSQSKSVATYVRLLQYLKPVMHMFIVGVLSTSAAGFLDGWLGQYMKPIINEGFHNADAELLFYAPLYILCYFMVRAVFGFLSLFCLYQAGNHIMSTLRQEAFQRFMGSQYATVKNANVGSFLSLLNYNVSQVEDATTGSLRRFLLDFVLITTAVVSLFSISTILSILVILLAPVMYYSMRIFTSRARNEASNIQNTLGGVIRYAEQSIHAVSTIRSMSAYEDVMAHFDQLLRVTLKHQKRFTVASSLMHASLQFATGIPIIAAFVCIVWRFIDLTPGDFAAFFYTIIRIMAPVRALSLVVTHFQKGVAAAESVFDICDLPQEQHRGERPFVLDTIHLKDVRCNLGDAVLFQGLSIDFVPDKIHVIVGTSGVGKSTLLAIIAQLITVDDGRVMLGEENYDAINIQDFRSNVGYMDQLPFVWDDSIRNNIVFPHKGDDYDKDLLEHVLSITSLMPWVDTLPYHYNTIIGQDALQPSGGQMQRIALARVLYARPTIILLDEPASAIDEHTTIKLFQYLYSIKKNRTIIIVAHQKFMAQRADCVYYMTSSGIIHGTHEELLHHESYNAYCQSHDHDDESA